MHRHIEGLIKFIEENRHDDESAHQAEDELRRYVLHAIAQGGEVLAADLARLALSTQDVRFAKWCA